MRPRRLAISVTLLASLAVPSTAAAGPLQTLVADLQQDGKITSCKYSPAMLTSALNSIPSDLDQYAPDLRRAIKAAIAQQGSGACQKKKAGGAPSPGCGGAPPAGRPPSRGRGTPAPSATGSPPRAPAGRPPRGAGP